MNLGKKESAKQPKWHIFVICIAAIALVLAVIYTDFMETVSPVLICLLGAVVLLGLVVIMLDRIIKVIGKLGKLDAKLDKIAESLEKNRAVMQKISQNTQLSEAVKAIASRDADRQSLREAVFDRLQKQDFDTTFEIIDAIAQTTSYSELAEQLRAEANKYQDATDTERENQVIAHIEKLFEQFQWAKASTLIERLIHANPASEKAGSMRQGLLDKKQKRKNVLLNAWDDAIKRQVTDRSLEILRELDQYLTPNEGLALQEAARDVFRTKLHNLGVQFSLAVSEKQWARALQTGEQIISEFPNSKMAEEIREKWDILKQKAQH